METETATTVTPLFKKRGPKANQIRKRPTTPPPTASDSESGYTSTEDEGRRIKRRKKSAVVTASSKDATAGTAVAPDLSTTKYEADRTAQITNTNDATKAADWYDEKNLLGATRPHPSKKNDSKTALIEQPPSGDGTYKGQAAYTSFIQTNPDHKPKTVGPVKASSNVRTITVTDFAPDVCKDYKQTGFCGFGDSCKFLHAREDYKQGWELDKDWEKVGGKAKTDGRKGGKSTQITDDMDSEEEDAALENIPFACVICKDGYKYPIVTKCGHYFCEACALKRYKKNPSCAICGAGTGGVFNGAKQLKRLLERKRERAKKKREKAIANGEELGEEEEEEGAETT